MEQLINDIYEIVKDYRADEDLPNVKMTKQRIQRWVAQFDEADKVFILTELKNILEKRYCSKQEVRNFLKEAVDVLQKHYSYTSASDFLLETVFLDLQRLNKSQPTLLKLMKQVLQEQFQFNMDNCGTRQKKNYIYLDDVLCTGNTLFQDIKTWVNKNDT